MGLGGGCIVDVPVKGMDALYAKALETASCPIPMNNHSKTKCKVFLTAWESGGEGLISRVAVTHRFLSFSTWRMHLNFMSFQKNFPRYFSPLRSLTEKTRSFWREPLMRLVRKKIMLWNGKIRSQTKSLGDLRCLSKKEGEKIIFLRNSIRLAHIFKGRFRANFVHLSRSIQHGGPPCEINGAYSISVVNISQVAKFAR